MGMLDRIFRRGRPVTEHQTTAALEAVRRPALQVGNVQGIGGRERQEDSFAIVNAANARQLEEKGLFAVVADGMGGMEEGRGASETAVVSFTQLFQSLLEEGDIPRQLREGAEAVSDGIFQRFGGQSGTTVVAVRILNGQLHWVSVGDSAIFLKRGECVFQLNREHTCLNDLYLQELEREPIQKERAEEDEDARRLTAFLGIDHLRRVDQSLRPWRLQAGDRVLLCSDGISGVLGPAELKEAMSLPPDEGCRLLETLVLEKGIAEQDNYTGILIAYDTSDRRDNNHEKHA